jgi:hypothetical protein
VDLEADDDFELAAGFAHAAPPGHTLW